jgi:hypothetical protein
VLNALFSEFCRAEKRKSISEGSFAFINSAVAFFFTFFSTKESKKRRPLGLQERILLIIPTPVIYPLTIDYLSIHHHLL